MTDDPGFVADVRRAASMWGGNPAVPVMYLLLGLSYLTLALVHTAPPDDCVHKSLGGCPVSPDDAGAERALSLLLFPLLLFQVGLSGTARVWYARRFAGDRLKAREIWPMSWRFFGRFFRLGLLFACVVIPVEIPAFVLAYQHNSRVPLLVGGAVATVLADVLFTFATPGLALYNESTWRAFTGGLKILRTSWPECAAYALVPPVALLLVAQAQPDAIGKPLAALFGLVSPLLTLLFAGAATSFVLRRWPPPGRDGSLAPPHWRVPAPDRLD
jgi:hypothetical protein